MERATTGWSDEFVQAVREAVDILDLVAEHTRVEKRGRRYVGLCPFHTEKTPSFSVDPERGLYYCFGCGAGGDAIKLHMETSGDDFRSAIEALARRYGVPVPARSERMGRAAELESALDAALAFFVDRLRRSERARAYLERRRISQDAIARFALGYAPDDWRELTEALEPRVSLPSLEAAGLVLRSRKSNRPFDRFRNRLMFPIHTPAGRLVGFGGRTLGDDPAKYVNTEETEAFQKKHLLYGLHLAKASIRSQRRVLLVEGYFDVLAAVQSGVDWVVASMGTALTVQQVKLLSRYTDEVIVGYDGDRAGEEASRKALPLLLESGLGVRRARFPAGQDPDSLRLQAGEDAVRSVIEGARDAVELELERLPAGIEREPRLQAQAAEQVRALVRPIRDAVLRFAYVRRAADQLGLPSELLWREVDEKSGRRAGGARVGAGTGEGHRAREVPSLEERVLQLLLGAPEAAAPPPSRPPDPEVFYDLDCRMLYEAYLGVVDRAGTPGKEFASKSELESAQENEPAHESANRFVVAVKDELHRRPDGSGAIDRLARVLLQETTRYSDVELQEGLRQLLRRWQQRRMRELSRALEQAQRDGDHQRLEELLELKVELSRELHRE